VEAEAEWMRIGGGGLWAVLRVGVRGVFREEERFVGVSGPPWTSEVVEIEAGMSGRGREIDWG
jgi:hypothetical protein